ncbi:MAG: hypothetical protein K6D54_05970 [Bacteroidales bacterium]|nr:hypothetical protein [Bacteroidales bacterium]
MSAPSDTLSVPATFPSPQHPQTTFPYTPTGPCNALGDENYHEIEFRTVGNNQDVEIELSSPGYISQTITAGRFVGNIRTMKVTKDNVLKTVTSNNNNQTLF